MLFLKILAFILVYVMCGMIMLLFALLTNEGKHKGINFETAKFSDCAFFIAFFPFLHGEVCICLGCYAC